MVIDEVLGEFELAALRWESPKCLVVGPQTRLKGFEVFSSIALERFELSPDNPYYESDGVGLYARDTHTLLAMVVPAEQYRLMDGCTEIAPKAFYNRRQLKAVELPDTLREIGALAFADSGLEELDAPNSLRVIAEKAFYLCRNLRTVELNEGLVEIGERAFAATSLVRLDLPAQVEKLGAAIAANLELTISPGNKHFLADGQGGIYCKAQEGIVLREIVDRRTTCYSVREGTVALEAHALQGHGAIEQVHLPDGLQDIGDYAFANCPKLRKVRFPESLRRIGMCAFRGTRLEEVHLPAGFEELGFEALFTNGDSFRKKPMSIRSVSVHPNCSRFYVQNDMLIERVEGHVPNPPDWFVREGAVAGQASHNRNLAEDEKRVQLENIVTAAYTRASLHDIGGGRATIAMPDYSLEFDSPAAEIAPCYYRDEMAKETVRLVLYFGDSGVIDVPPEVDALGANALSYARNVRELRMHDGLAVIEPGLYMPKIPAHIHVEYREPRAGRKAVDAYFPQQILGDQPFVRSLLYKALDPVELFERVDASIPSSSSIYEEARLILWRLGDPFLLDDGIADMFRAFLRREIISVCKAFAGNQWMHGFVQLAEQGLFDKASITRAIDEMGACDYLEAASYLLELKRAYFENARGADYSL